MQIKTIAATAAFALLNGQALADTLLEAEYLTGNKLLTGPDGKGKTAGLKLETSSGSGLVSLRVAQAHDTAGRADISQSMDFPGFASASATASWYKQTDAKFAEVKKSFLIFNTLDLSYGAYAGYVTGTAGYNAEATAQVKVQSITMPGQTYMGYTLPSMTMNIPGFNQTMQEQEKKTLSSPYGGLLFGAELPLQTSKHTQLRLSASGHIGAERMGYGAGAAFVYTTQPVGDDRQMPHGACDGSPYKPKSGLAFTLALCADQTASSRLYDAEERVTQRYANKLNAHAGTLGVYADQLRARTGGRIDYKYIQPTYTSADVMRVLGIQDPTAEPQLAIKLGMSGSVGRATYSVFGSIPVKGIKNKQIGIGLGYRF